MKITKSNEYCCNHCWHNKQGAIWMVLPDGFIVQVCCKCHEERTIHVDHAHEGRRPRFTCSVENRYIKHKDSTLKEANSNG